MLLKLHRDAATVRNRKRQQRRGHSTRYDKDLMFITLPQAHKAKTSSDGDAILTKNSTYNKLSRVVKLLYLQRSC